MISDFELSKCELNFSIRNLNFAIRNFIIDGNDRTLKKSPED